MEVYVVTVTAAKMQYYTSNDHYPSIGRTFIDLLDGHEQLVFATEKAAIRFLKDKFSALSYPQSKAKDAVLKGILFALEEENLSVALPLINTVSELPVSVRKLTLEGHVLS